METDDRLILVVVNRSDFDTMELKQKWFDFELILLEALDKLEGPYITTFYYDCGWLMQ